MQKIFRKINGYKNEIAKWKIEINVESKNEKCIYSENSSIRWVMAGGQKIVLLGE